MVITPVLQDTYKVFRSNTQKLKRNLKYIYRGSSQFRIVATYDGTHYILKVDESISDLWELSNEDIDKLLLDQKKAIQIEIKNIEQVRLQYNMFLLVTRDEDGLTQLYHGVIELYADPSEPQLNVLIPDGI